jgi:phenylpyruvate tautomerase PptA (4-oxalocrotonate tautomerase family)
MPLIRISLRAGQPAERRRAIADAVHQALVEATDVPADDRFQIVTEHPAAALIYDRQYLGIARSDDLVIVQIAWRRGRTVAMKRALYQRIAERLRDAAGVRPEDVFVTLVENELADWSFGHGVAQYVKE